MQSTSTGMFIMPEQQHTQESKDPKPTFQKRATPIIQISVSSPASIIQRARTNPKILTYADVTQLQRTIGNRAVGKLLSEIGLISSTTKQATVQRQKIPEEKGSLQGNMIDGVQRQIIPKPIKSGVLQAKLIIGELNDIYEHPANLVSYQVMRIPKHFLQRKGIAIEKASIFR